MGIGTELYRCRIGLFSPNRSCSFKNNQPQLGFRGLSFRLVPAVTLCCLLLIAGIELNPGPPIYKCKYCDLSSSSISQYARHAAIHKLRKNFNVPCPYCDRQMKFASLESHISRFHRSARLRPQVMNIQMVKCSTCRLELSTRKDYMDHMQSHLKAGVQIQCVLSNCQTPFMDKRKFQKHMSRCHAGVADFFEPTVVSVSECRSSSDEHSDEDGDADAGGQDKNFDCTEGAAEDFDPYPYSTIKDEVAKFYLRLEGDFNLPTSTVQMIAEQIKLITELSHHRLKIALKQELESFQIDALVISSVIGQTFKADPIFNVHHKSEDTDHLGTHHLRKKYWEKHFPYVDPKEHYYGLNRSGKRRIAHLISIKETLKVLLKNEKIKEKLLKSFSEEEAEPTSVKKDYKDGEAFKKHKCQHNGEKCIQINLFQDAFDFNAFGPSFHKTLGFYYSLASLDPESISKVDLIQIAGLIVEKDLVPTEQEELDGKDVLKEAIQPILDELKDLRENGTVVDGETIPVCLFLLIGDSLGQHTVGGYVKSFSCEFFCRFCPISRTEFHLNPSETKAFRTTEEYDSAVQTAYLKWDQRRKHLLKAAQKATMRKARKAAEKVAARCSAPAKKTLMRTVIPQAAYKKLCAISYKAVKYRPSPFNSIPGFHCSSPSQPVCIAHDLFEGILKCVLPCVMDYFISEKEWFDLPTLNRRITNFKCKGSDARDRPKPFKSIDKLSGHAVENWNTLRLLPIMIADLIEDPDDEVWKVFLNLKEIVEYVCAPKISMAQVAYLKQITRTFANSLKTMDDRFPNCLIPKVHFLCHYSDLIDIFGPLIKVCTLRFESVHMFFKAVIRNSKNYINVTKTMAEKYMLRFASHNSSDLFPADIVYDPSRSRCINLNTFPAEKKSALPENFNPSQYEVLDTIKVKGTEYKTGYYIPLNSSMLSTSLQVGKTDIILLDSSGCVCFLVQSMEAENSFQGYFTINSNKISFQLLKHEELNDYYPLPSYEVTGKKCITLKHSICDEI
ncbi:Zinc finger and BTB domain-containing protein 17 [Frankliniella fusca]|uniref:Zinc finger and BTB domain-containing protein 17 n=1 Tax=Frankliniella fusca TaxID=407009 RepID=A0AAE1I3B0_9NEOP|nr:Zinc finger and BTB domain-containing protein 17 [Frankliniella fusca]